jgi:hypothetical protein
MDDGVLRGDILASLARMCSAGDASAGAAGRLYLDVPFAEKEEAKRLGARWDAAAKKWYAPSADTPAAKAFRPCAADVAGERHYLAVPFARKEEAKRLGARWDAAAKRWYAQSADGPAAKAFRGGDAEWWYDKKSTGEEGDWDINDLSEMEREQDGEMRDSFVNSGD